MGVSLTIHSSILQFLLTNLKEEKYPGIEALNLFEVLLEICFANNRRSRHWDIFLNEAVPRFVRNQIMNKKNWENFKKSF